MAVVRKLDQNSINAAHLARGNLRRTDVHHDCICSKLCRGGDESAYHVLPCGIVDQQRYMVADVLAQALRNPHCVGVVDVLQTSPI